MTRVSVALGSLYFTIHRDFIQGIWDYILRNNPQWDMSMHPTDFYQSFTFTRDMIPHVDGVIGFFRDGKIIDDLIRSKLPVVNLTYSGSAVPFPFVAFNSEAIGKLAADHLATNARRKMVYIGPDGPVCRIRRESFARAIKSKLGMDVEMAIYRHDNMNEGDSLLEKAIFNPLKSNSERIAVFAFSDSYAFSLIQAVTRRGYSIPDHVAILGCDNDDRICELSPVSISSIPLNGRNLGFRAAKLMHDMLSGNNVPHENWVEPLAVVERASTSPFVTDDAVVANALNLVRQNLSGGINVSELAQMMSLSYRQLERLFQDSLGVSPKAIINKLRIEKCKQLLSEDTLTNAQIARASGFSNANVFEQAFKKLTGKQPKSFRALAKRQNGAGKRR